MVTLVPASAVGARARCTQYVSPTGGKYWWTSAWLAPTVRAAAESKSLPTPKTHDLSAVVTRVALGAPASELADATAPMAPAPFTPVISTFEKLTTVIDESTACDIVATTVTAPIGVGAKARQTSLEPACTLVRPT